MSSSELHTLHKAFVEAGGYWSTFVIWAKNHFTLGRSDYQRQYGPFSMAGNRVPSATGAENAIREMWVRRQPVCNDLHPTMKPGELIERAIRNSSRSGGWYSTPSAVLVRR